MMLIRLASKLQKDSIVDGEGIRAVVWTQGCPHHCPSCHNQETWDYEGGYLEDIEDLKEEINSLDDEVGITFSGGDPFEQAEACASIAKYAHSVHLNVWAYTGYTFEQLLKKGKKDPHIMSFLRETDILVDGPFVLKLKSYEIKFRGSKNQRLIKVKESLETGKVVLYDLDKKSKKEKKQEVYI
ncbi:MAG: anaerobic ribonucleoside-triphosphate reductase activating protein [Clostridia bacterium]|nr:anaerobic ribonucleoside-triphosphate reductase activating protein [Clostridia bacterium]